MGSYGNACSYTTTGRIAVKELWKKIEELEAGGGISFDRLIDWRRLATSERDRANKAEAIVDALDRGQLSLLEAFGKERSKYRDAYRKALKCIARYQRADSYRFSIEDGHGRFIDGWGRTWACSLVLDDTEHEQIGQEWV
jgi:hypothetical protein